MTWSQLVAYVVRLLKIEQVVEKHKSDIEKLQQQVDALTDDLQSQVRRADNDRDNAERDRRELLLQLENVLLKAGIKSEPQPLLEDRNKAEMRAENDALREQVASLQQQLEVRRAEEDETQ